MTSRNQLNTVDQNRSTSREMTKANQATPPSLSSHGSRARTPVPPTKDTADAWRTESYCPLDTTPIAPLPAAIRKLQGPKLTAMFIDDKEPPIDIKETRAVQKHLAAYKWPPCDPAKVWRDTADQRNRLYILNNERHEPCSRGMCPHIVASDDKDSVNGGVPADLSSSTRLYYNNADITAFPPLL